MDQHIDNEIRITSQGKMRSYITHATALLQDKGVDEVLFKGMGRGISQTVIVVETIKRSIEGLHQISSIQSTDITNCWEPPEEDLRIPGTRNVTMMTITLSKKEMDTKNIGYQPPNRASRYPRDRGTDEAHNFHGKVAIITRKLGAGGLWSGCKIQIH